MTLSREVENFNITPKKQNQMELSWREPAQHETSGPQLPSC